MTTKTELTPLERETRTAIPTREAAPHLGRACQTLRIWAANDTGPIRPVRVNGRLLWPVDDIRRLLGLATESAESANRSAGA
jgi:hypothetical protein